MTDHNGEGGQRLRPLGMDAGGCTESCLEMHTFSWPCEQAMVDEDYGTPTRRPWRCRHGWHDWRFVSMSDVREVDVVGHPMHYVCRLVERCERCRLKRTKHHADVPKHPKMPTYFGGDGQHGD